MVNDLLGKKIILLISNSKKKYFMLAGAVVLIIILLNSIIFSNHNDNPLDGKNIVIDPGHGGVDSGTTDYSNFFEKDVNLQIAKRLQKALQSKNANADLTRDTDISLDRKNSSSSSRHIRDLNARVNQFNSGKYDLFISIHINHSVNSNAIGPIVLFSPKLPSTELLANSIQNRLNNHIQTNIGSDVRHNSIKSDYYILINSDIPGVIVETGFISNLKEKELLRNESYQTKLAKSIQEGIKDYFEDIIQVNAGIPEFSLPQNNTPQDEDSPPINSNNETQIVKNKGQP